MENPINKINTFKEPIEKKKDSIETDKEINDYKIENVSENIEKNNNEVEKDIEIHNKISENLEKKDETSKNITSNNAYIQEIEDIILNNGVKEIYESMNPKKQQRFEKELRKTSIEISDILTKVKENILKAINKIFSLVRKLIFQLGISDYGYAEKMIKNKVEDIIKIKRGEDK